MFQSTRPIRGATFWITIPSVTIEFQSTRPIRGATGGDTSFVPFVVFQSTRPIRGATSDTNKSHMFIAFQSTRPIRGATWLALAACRPVRRFNPRAPYEARQEKKEATREE